MRTKSVRVLKNRKQINFQNKITKPLVSGLQLKQMKKI